MHHKRVLVTRYGGPAVITVIEEDIPAPRASRVRVKALAAGVSLPDVLAREGVHPETARVPYTPGWDLVGAVDRLTGYSLVHPTSTQQTTTGSLGSSNSVDRQEMLADCIDEHASLIVGHAS